MIFMWKNNEIFHSEFSDEEDDLSSGQISDTG